MRGDVLGAHQELIPAWLQPLTVLDLCRARGVNLNKVLPGTGLFLDDLPLSGRRISALQFQRLLHNANSEWSGEDFPFQLGHVLANHGFGPLHGYLQCVTGIAVPEAIQQFSLLAAAGIKCRYIPCSAKRGLLLLSSAARVSLDPIHGTAVTTALCHALKRRQDLRVADVFVTGEGRYPEEQYLSHLGLAPQFSAPFDGLVLEIDTAKPGIESLRQGFVQEECRRVQGNQRFLLDVMGELLQPALGAMPDLSACADRLHTSPATLKRRLKEHGVSFQSLVDANQRERALVELLLNSKSIDDISELLYFHDSSNFRRAFKRWTGTTPSMMKRTFNDLINI